MKLEKNVNGYNVSIQVEVITPAEASEILAKHNTKNRRPNKNHVKALALCMQCGMWRFNGDPIRFDALGNLMDGQHRLMAQELSQETITYIIIRGLDPECFKAIDTEAKSRSLVDMLYIDNIKDCHNVSSIVNRYFGLSNGLAALSSPRANGSAMSTKIISTKVSQEEKYNFYYEYQQLFDEITAIARNFNKRLRMLSISDIGGLFAYLFIDKHHSYDEVNNFFTQLFIASEYNCINTLRNRLIADMTATKKMSGSGRQNLIAKVWNYYIAKKDVQVLAYNPTKEGTIEFI